ncbi:MAG TPA: hypothetical protein VHP83_00310, partial [Aggregatilineaceae bacterium]|nr:hypothetical protein [Aggregatilineaceae bacterium]
MKIQRNFALLLTCAALVLLVGMLTATLTHAQTSGQQTVTPTATLAAGTGTTTTGTGNVRQMNCTFTTGRAGVNLRNAPGTGSAVNSTARAGQTFTINGQTTASDGFVWWRTSTNLWIRSDLGTSTCPAVCGNKVCESGETSTACASDCTADGASTTGATNASTTSSALSCVAASCEDCYESISCYPDCNVCTCSNNEFGCPVCRCDYAAGGGGTTTTTNGTTTGTGTTSNTSGGCVYASCEACIAA